MVLKGYPTKKFIVSGVGIAVLLMFLLLWWMESCERREIENHKAYISSLSKGKTYVARPGDIISLPDGTELRFISFSSGNLFLMAGPYLYFPKDHLKVGDWGYFGDLALDLRPDTFRGSMGSKIKLPFVLHILSADRNLIIYRLSKE